MPIPLLCEIIAQRGTASAESFRHRAGYSGLLRAGVLKETGVVQSVPCNDCDAPHDAAVEFEDGRYGYFCPELGFVPLARDRIVQIEPDMERLVDHLATTLNCKRRRSKPLHGATWRVGTIETEQGGVMIYVHPWLKDENDLRDLGAALQREVISTFTLVLTAHGTLTAEGTRTLNLADAVELDAATSALRAITNLPAIAGVRPTRTGGARNQFEQRFLAVLEERNRRGVSLEGRNEEAKVALQEFRKRFPSETGPSVSSANRYVTKFRGGS